MEAAKLEVCREFSCSSDGKCTLTSVSPDPCFRFLFGLGRKNAEPALNHRRMPGSLLTSPHRKAARPAADAVPAVHTLLTMLPALAVTTIVFFLTQVKWVIAEAWDARASARGFLNQDQGSVRLLIDAMSRIYVKYD